MSSHTLRITAATLLEIAAVVGELEYIGADVPVVRVAGYRVTLERQDHQLDGVTVWITAIEALTHPGGDDA